MVCFINDLLLVFRLFFWFMWICYKYDNQLILCPLVVYDVTIGYKKQRPLFIDNALGTDPREVHIHVRRIPVNDIPSDESEVSSWLMNEFSRKDELLDQFYTEGSFSDSSNSIEEKLSVATCIFNFCTIMVFSCIMLMVIFSSLHWVKVYVAFSCVFLTAATYLNYKPVPILWLKSKTSFFKFECRVYIWHCPKQEYVHNSSTSSPK